MNVDNELNEKGLIMPVDINKPAKINDLEKQPSLLKNEEVDNSDENKDLLKNEEVNNNESNSEENVVDNVLEQIIIDDISYTLDKDGNAIKDNKVIYTADDLKAMSEYNNEQESLLSDIANISGIKPLDESGNIIEYEWSVEGLAKRESDIHNIGLAEGFNKGFNQFLSNNPDIAQIIEYKSKFGTIEGFNTTIDYSKITLDDNDDSKFNIIYTAEIQRGNTPERAKRLAEFSRTNNTLDEDANISLEYLRKTQESVILERNKKIIEQEQLEHKKEIAFYGVDYSNNKETVVKEAQGSLYDCIINKGSIKNYQIPIEGLNVKTEKGIKKMSRKELFDYISKPVTEIDGYYYTQAQLDDMKNNSNPEDYALRCIMNLNGGINSLVEKSIATKEIKKLKTLSASKNITKGNKQKLGDTNDTTPILKLPVNVRE